MKKIKTKIKIQVPAGEATPAPPLGPALAPHGINLGNFCNQFNQQTEKKRGWTIPVEITVYEDGSFDFVTKTPPTSEFLKKAAGVEKGSGEPLQKKAGEVTKEQIYEIAEEKIADLNTSDIEKAAKTIEGTAKAMGIKVKQNSSE